MISKRVRLPILAVGLTLAIGCSEKTNSSEGEPRALVERRDSATLDSTVRTESAESRFRFDLANASSAPEFTYRDGQEAQKYTILESLGGGCAIIDFDRDGRNDIAFAGGGRFPGEREIAGCDCALFRRHGDDFVDATRAARITGAAHYNHGVIAADYDSDGFVDVLVTGYGGLQLFHNLGDGTFEELAIAASLTDQLWSSSAAWADFDRDGNLDLFAAHYANWSFDNDPQCFGVKPGDRDVCPPRRYTGQPPVLYFSNGDGTFRDETKSRQLRTDDKGLGTLAADFDRDGDIDLYVTNDTVPNDLYKNDGAGNFEDVSLTSGASLNDRGLPDGSMGVDLCDFNLDGLPDIWVVNYENESAALYQNEGEMFFRHVSQPTGMTAVGGTFVGWGTCCFDADLDGDEDMFVSNGHVIRHPVNAPLRQKPLLMENVKATRFRNAGAQIRGYFSEPHMGRGAAAGDLDGDGRLDLVVSHVNEPVAVLMNRCQAEGEWIEFDLIGLASPRDAVGAVVTLKTSAGAQTRDWKGGGSYASTNARALHFGIPKAATIESIEIRWPSGQVQAVRNFRLYQVNQVVESSGARTGLR